MCTEAYAAGMLDGEGCIYISPGTTHQHQLSVVFSQTDSRSLEFLAYRYGGRVRPGKVTSAGRPTYQWHLTGKSAMDFLSSVRPYLIIKEEQADIAARWPTWKGWGAGSRGAPRHLPQEIRDDRENLRQELLALRRT